MPTKTATPEMTLEAAQDALEALHERLMSGDARVTPSMLLEAESLVRFTQAQERAAERAAAERAAAERAATLEAIRQRLADEFDRTELEQLGDALEQALDAYVAAAEHWNTRLATLRDELQAHGFSTERGVGLYNTDDVTPGLRIGTSMQYQQVPKPRIDAAIQTVMRRYFPRGY